MSDWITDRLPGGHETDEDGDVLVPPDGPSRHIDWTQAVTIKLGEPWMPAPPPYVPPKTREELVQDLLDAVDDNSNAKFETWKLKVLEAREKLK